MKTISTPLAILFTALASFAVGCAAQTGDESTATSVEAVMNNGGGPDCPSLDTLLASGYHCVWIDIPETPLMCGKNGTGSVYMCNPETHVCVLPSPSTAPSKPAPPAVIHVPVGGSVKGVQ